MKNCKNRKNNDPDADYILTLEYTLKFSVEDLISDYQQGSSLPDLLTKYGTRYRESQQLLKLKNVKIRSRKESCNENKKHKYKNTSIQRHGVDNISKLESVKEKKKQTFLKNYGVDNIRKYKPFYDYVNVIMIEKYGQKRITNPEKISDSRQKFTDEKWEDIQEKFSKTMSFRYGLDDLTKKKIIESGIDGYNKKWWKSLSDIEKNEVLEKKFIGSSKIEKIVSDFLDRNHIRYTPQRFIKGKSYDFLIEDSNVLIEVNGDYWHANPSLYKKDDEINYPGLKIIRAEDVWKRDLDKRNNAIEFGYVVLYLWEKDIYENLRNQKLDFFILDEIQKLNFSNSD